MINCIRVLSARTFMIPCPWADGLDAVDMDLVCLRAIRLRGLVPVLTRTMPVGVARRIVVLGVRTGFLTPLTIQSKDKTTIRLSVVPQTTSSSDVRLSPPAHALAKSLILIEMRSVRSFSKIYLTISEMSCGGMFCPFKGEGPLPNSNGTKVLPWTLKKVV